MSDPRWFCHLCSNRPIFTRKFNLDRHITSKHNSEFFECAECGLRFTRKDSLKLHIIRNHTDDRPVFECAHCAKTFGTKHTLYIHITGVHRDLAQSDYEFECFHCSSVFRKLFVLRRHIQKVHMDQRQNPKVSRFTCLKCSTTFCSSKVLNKHYVDVHDVVLNYQNLEFDCVESFKEWLENHQRQIVTRYSTWYKKNNANYSMQRFICHRSGRCRASVTEHTRKRHLKTSGYKHLGGVCPAEIRLHVREDGTCSIDYQTTHVGHNIGDESELKHMFLTNEEKKIIAAEIQSGVPLGQIVNRSRLTNSGRDMNRLSLVTRKDVRNIATSLKLDFQNREYVKPGCDKMDVESIIEQHKDGIPLYKKKNEEDTQFNLLRDEDFAIVIMTANQESYLRNYGHKVICLDGTYNTNSYGFSLHSLTVLDTDCEELTAAFLITNRNDECVIDIFLTCIQDRVGNLEPQTLMTDMQPTYWDSWIKIMKNVPPYYVFSTWHVHEAWRKNFFKITDKKKRNDVRNELYRLSLELDPIEFENGLNSFLSRNDDELMEFRNYFVENFGSNSQRWACCYRAGAGIDMHINTRKAFHKSLKFNIARGQKIQNLTQCLVSIFDYLTLLESNILERKIRGKITNKLSFLRKRHKEALEEYSKEGVINIIVINDDMYMVQSSSQADNFYTISRCESKECDRDNNERVSKSCRLLCDSCNLCFHCFSCTCEDSTIKLNMCKHIHLVGLYLKDQEPKSEADAIDEVDVPVSYLATDENSNADPLPSHDVHEIYLVKDESPSSFVLEDDQSEANVDVTCDAGEKQKLIQLIHNSFQEVEERLVTFGEGKLERIYDKLRPVIMEMGTEVSNLASCTPKRKTKKKDKKTTQRRLKKNR